MKSNRILNFAMCLCVAFVMLTGSSLAGTTTVVSGVVNYAREVGAINTVYTIPSGKLVRRQLGVIRNSAQDFFVTVTLGSGLQFATGTLPAAGNLGLQSGQESGGAISPSIVNGGTDGATSVTFLADVTTSFNGFATLELAVGKWTLRDTTNVLGPGGTYTISIATSDAGTGAAIDTGGESANFLTGLYGIDTPILTSTTATVDVASGRLNFLATSPDTTTSDKGAAVTLLLTSGTIYGAAGTTYGLVSGDSVTLTLAGTLNGIKEWTYAGISSTITDSITSEEVIAGSSTLTITGSNLTGAFGAGAGALALTVDGTTILSARTLTVSAALVLSGGAGGPAANGRSLLFASTVTTWSLNGTVLVSAWVNGNNTTLLSRVYIWNLTASRGAVLVRVFTLPVGFGGSTLLGTVSLGTLEAYSGANVRVAEDILTPLGVPLPYRVSGGNLGLEFTIQTVNALGYTQSFSSTLAYGTTPLIRMP